MNNEIAQGLFLLSVQTDTFGVIGQCGRLCRRNGFVCSNRCICIRITINSINLHFWQHKMPMFWPIKTAPLEDADIVRSLHFWTMRHSQIFTKRNGLLKSKSLFWRTAADWWCDVSGRREAKPLRLRVSNSPHSLSFNFHQIQMPFSSLHGSFCCSQTHLLNCELTYPSSRLLIELECRFRECPESASRRIVRWII